MPWPLNKNYIMTNEVLAIINSNVCFLSLILVYMFFLWCRWLLNQLLDKHAVTSDEKARIIFLQQQMAKSAKIGIDVNQNRNLCICMLFSEFDKLTTMIDLYRGMFTCYSFYLSGKKSTEISYVLKSLYWYIYYMLIFSGILEWNLS